jgi:hypothetical protein
MSDPKDMFGGDEPAEVEVTSIEPEAPIAPEPVVELEAPEAEEQPLAPPVQPEAPIAPPEGFVPIQSVHEARRKAREWEEQARQLQAMLAQQQVEVPDQFADPDGYQAYQTAQFQQVVWKTKLDLSESMARERFGDATVDGAVEWGFELCSQNPGFNQQVLTAKDPIGFVVKEHKRQLALKALGDADPSEVEQFRAWKAANAQIPAQRVAAIPATAIPPQQATMPPRSLASVTSAGSSPAPKPSPAAEFVASKFG